MFYIGCIDVQIFPEDDQDRWKHVGVMTISFLKIVNITAFVDFIVWMAY
jgi:hypothetical protein